MPCPASFRQDQAINAVYSAAHSSHTATPGGGNLIQEVQHQHFFQACNTSSPWQSGTLLGLAWRAAELEVCKSLLLMVGEILISNVMMAACNLPHGGWSLTKALVTFHVYKGRNSW